MQLFVKDFSRETEQKSESRAVKMQTRKKKSVRPRSCIIAVKQRHNEVKIMTEQFFSSAKFAMSRIHGFLRKSGVQTNDLFILRLLPSFVLFLINNLYDAFI